MLTKLILKNFKLFKDVEIELGKRVVFIGPNNSGKSSALQALSLWDIGVKKWLEKQRNEKRQSERIGVAINRQDLISIPIPSAKLLWKELRLRISERKNDKYHTQNVRIEIGVEGVNENEWKCKMEFDYANEESIYCRPAEKDSIVPPHLRGLSVAYLPPMSGLVSREDKLELGSIKVRLGEGRTAEVLRNLCWQVTQSKDGEKKWEKICTKIKDIFGSTLNQPKYIPERGEIILTYKNSSETLLDISSSGRGEQQTLLLLSYLAINENSILLLDEPDAHLEILRQRQIYEILSQFAEDSNSQIIIASHSEVILNEAVTRDIVIAFIEKPHRIEDKGSQVLKSLRSIGFEHYLQAMQKGWVLYLEDSTDLEILRTFAEKLNHPAKKLLDLPFVHYVANQPRKAQEHFYALREAKPNLVGIAIYDRLSQSLPENPNLKQIMWEKCEIENYLSQKETLLNFAESEGKKWGKSFSQAWRKVMEESIKKIENAIKTLGKDPSGKEIKASEDFLEPIFKNFYKEIKHPNLMAKSNFYILANFVPEDKIDDEIKHVLDEICSVANSIN